MKKWSLLFVAVSLLSIFTLTGKATTTNNTYAVDPGPGPMMSVYIAMAESSSTNV